MNVQKWLNWTIKLAGVMITAPATVTVAGRLFDDVPGLWRLAVQVAAVALVEGVFLLNWILLDTDKRADFAYKLRYAVSAVSIYGGLWALAIAHGEGVAGIVFRLALGLALAGSVYDAGVYDRLRAARKADSDVSNTGRVKRLSRRLSIEDTRLQLHLDSEHRQAVAQAEHDARMESVKVYADQLRSAAYAEHAASYGDAERSTPEWRIIREAIWERDGKVCTECRADLSKSADEYHCHHIRPVSEGGKTTPDNLTTLCPSCHQRAHGGSGWQMYPIAEARQARTAQQRDKKQAALDTLLHTLQDDPDVSKTTLADTAGVSRSTVYSYLDELQADGQIVKADTGSGYKVYTNGNRHLTPVG